MARTIGLADTTAKTIANRPPRLLIIAGATGTGKSTVSMTIAAKSNFARLISTDAIREILRSTDELQTDPALHRSSFSIGDSVLTLQAHPEFNKDFSLKLLHARKSSIDPKTYLESTNEYNSLAHSSISLVVGNAGASFVETMTPVSGCRIADISQV